MTRFFRTGLVLACVTILSNWTWAQGPVQFEGFAPGWGVPYNHGHQGYQPAAVSPELVPADPFSGFDTHLDLELGQLTRGMSFKTEYLYADFQRPGNNLLGAPLGGVSDPRDPFVVVPGVAPLLDQTAYVPDTSRLEQGAQNGVRATLEIPAFQNFTLVGSYVGMQHMSSGFTVTPGNVSPEIAALDPTLFDPAVFPDNTRFIATSMLLTGLPGTNVILYDRSFEADFAAQYWSGDVNLLYDYVTPTTGFRFQPLMGFRFTSYDETLIQHGEFDNGSELNATLGVLGTPFRNTIRSSTQNIMCLGQFGFQMELVEEWFTLGFSPKFGLGSNSIRTNVLTNNLRYNPFDLTATDPATSSQKNNVIFGSSIDLSAYTKIRLTEWLSLTGSVFYWYLPTVARSSNAIVYDDFGLTQPPAIHSRIKTNSMSVIGLTVGAQITF